MSHNIQCSWQVPYERHEITHQLEEGEAPPKHTRYGLIIDFLPYFRLNRSGIGESYTVAVILQNNIDEIMVRPLTQVKVEKHPVYTLTADEKQQLLRWAGA